jgi:biopolymer transport protein ExbB/TolQ
MDMCVMLAQHAAERAASQFDRGLARGVKGLATVAATAPLLGVFATLWGIVGSFTGCSCAESTA